MEMLFLPINKLNLRRYRKAGMLLGALLLFSCGGSDSSAGDAASSQDPGDLCAQWAETPAPGGGIGQFCTGAADCSCFDLQCALKEKGDPNAFCTTTCEVDADCPSGNVCGEYEGMSVCVPGEICAPCDNAEQCGKNAPACVKNNDGASFCTRECNPGSPDCGPGNKCFRPNFNDPNFYCGPITENCVGAGGNCDPCVNDDDCLEGNICYTSFDTGERYCAVRCEDDENCPRDFRCLKAGKDNVCAWHTGEQFFATCMAGVLGFCEYCDDNFQCESNICYKNSASGVSHCAIPCEGQLDKHSCPEGTFCVTGPGGWVCSPPNAYKCSGWLNCVGVECAPGEVCQKGFCIEVE